MIVLNSPFEKLDSADRTMMKSIIEMLGEIKTVIISANHHTEISDICDSIALLSDGELKYFGAPEALAVVTEETVTKTEDEKEGE